MSLENSDVSIHRYDFWPDVKSLVRKCLMMIIIVCSEDFFMNLIKIIYFCFDRSCRQVDWFDIDM